MKLANLLYMVNSIKTDEEFPLTKMVIEFKLPKYQYLSILKEVNNLLYKTDEYDYVQMFEVTISDITFRIINES